MPKAASHLLVLALFAALTAAMTWPIILQPGRAVRDLGDPLLNSWILTWDARQLAAGNLGGFFDANIFYPHRRTLAYSEHLFPQALAAAPVLAATRNPVLAYNVVLLLSFLTSGFAMYLYASHLTGRTAAGVLAGIVYGFSPFMFDHLSHVQLLAAAGFPLVFLFMARFFAHERWSDLVLLALCAAAQILANGYYAVFLSFVGAAVVIYHVLAAGWLRRPEVLGKLAAGGLLVAALTGPFLWQYVALQRDVGFRQHPGFFATPASFLAAPQFNRLYGGLVEGPSEARLFPGLVAVALAAFAVARAVRSRPFTPVEPSPLDRVSLSGTTLYRVALVAVAAVAAAVLFKGRLHATTSDFTKPVILLALLLGGRAFFDPAFRARWFPPLTAPNRWLWVHVVLLVFGVLASFGTSISGPYEFLYAHVPGFDGLRAVPRIHIVTLLSLGVLAAFGVRELQGSRRIWVRRVATFALPVVALVELVSVPLPVEPAPTLHELPPVYHWLADRDGHEPILELPFGPRGHPRGTFAEIFRVYASTLHWRPMVNGFSGYMPPAYLELRERWLRRPWLVVEDARQLGVGLVVLHTDMIEPERLEKVHAALSVVQPAPVEAYRDPTTEVWSLEPLPEAGRWLPPVPERELLPRDGWQVAASVNPEIAGLALDGDRATRWQSGPQRPGFTFTLDLGGERELRGVEIDLADSAGDVPRGFIVEVAAGPGAWHEVARGRLRALPITSYLRPTRPALAIPFEAVRAERLRITTTVGQRDRYWSIHEIYAW